MCPPRNRRGGHVRKPDGLVAQVLAIAQYANLSTRDDVAESGEQCRNLFIAQATQRASPIQCRPVFGATGANPGACIGAIGNLGKINACRTTLDQGRPEFIFDPTLIGPILSGTHPVVTKHEKIARRILCGRD